MCEMKFRRMYCAFISSVLPYGYIFIVIVAFVYYTAGCFARSLFGKFLFGLLQNVIDILKSEVT